MSKLISIRPIRVYCWTATCIAFIMSITSVQRISWTVLASVPAAIRIIFFNDWWFLFNNLQLKCNYCYKLKKENKQQHYFVNICFFSAFACNILYMKKSITSVRAQLQLIAVHRKIFINNMIKNNMPNVIANHNSHGGRMPLSSQTAETSVIKFLFILFFVSVLNDIWIV